MYVSVRMRSCVCICVYDDVGEHINDWEYLMQKQMQYQLGCASSVRNMSRVQGWKGWEGGQKLSGHWDIGQTHRSVANTEPVSPYGEVEVTYASASSTALLLCCVLFVCMRVGWVGGYGGGGRIMDVGEQWTV